MRTRYVLDTGRWITVWLALALIGIGLAAFGFVGPGWLGLLAFVLHVGGVLGAYYFLYRLYTSAEGVEREAWRDAAVGTLAVAFVLALVGSNLLKMLAYDLNARTALNSMLAASYLAWGLLLRRARKRRT